MIKIKSPVTWIGNKTSILHILYALFPIGCDRYVEPFGGSGAVLLGKPVPDKFEVFNDYNHNLVNLFRCMRDRPMEFIRELGFLSLNSRDDFAILKKFFEKEEFTEDYLKAQLDLTEIMLPEMTAKEVRTLYSAARNDHDLRRAAMFLKLIRYSYSSGCKSFACQPFSLRTLFALVQDFAKRCENVVIENQDFETLIKHYDRPTTFTYCDPPYFTSEYVYDCGFTWEDHLRLYHALAGMKGKFLLSYNDCPEIRELYKRSGLTGNKSDWVYGKDYVYCFCIERGIPLPDNTEYAGSADASHGDKYKRLTENQKDLLKLALTYGYPNRVGLQTSKDANACYAATQLIVWQITMGFRSSATELNDKTYPMSGYSGTMTEQYTRNKYLKVYYDAILSDMARHYTRPSFTAYTPGAAKTFELEYKNGKYTVTLTDSNNIHIQRFRRLHRKIV